MSFPSTIQRRHERYHASLRDSTEITNHSICGGPTLTVVGKVHVCMRRVT